MYYNKTFRSFKRLGYHIINLSPFSVEGHEAAFKTRFLPVDLMLIMYPSLWDDVIDIFPVYFARSINNQKLLKELYQKEFKKQTKLMDSVIQLSKEHQTLPLFVYLHLNMPHAPYLCKINGDINLEYLSKHTVNFEDKKTAYLEYIQFTNSFILKKIRELKPNLQGDDIILIMSDHGSKELFKRGNEIASVNTLNAIFISKDERKSWYKGISNVNQFCVLFSEITGDKIPLLKDSVVLY